MEKKYETRPWKLWGKAKELRANYYKEVMTAKEQGKLLVAGGTDSIVSLPAGLGPYVFFGGEPYGATLATDKALSLQCVEAVPLPFIRGVRNNPLDAPFPVFLL